jgi:indole-3-glycerol phosphate synthase
MRTILFPGSPESSRTPGPATADLLATVVAATRRIVEVREQREPLSVLAARAERRDVATGRFRAALLEPPVETPAVKSPVVVKSPVGNCLQAVPEAPEAVPKGSLPRIIAECKRRSPSRGVLRPDYDPVAIAQGYEKAGAAAISVLTEPTFFDGALEHLEAVRGAVGIPVLRKDFVVSEYQLLEARAARADAVLLIAAALDARALAALHARALALGLDVLVEVHNADELSVAIDAGAQIVGVNNRNLRTLEIDVTASEMLAARMPRGMVTVSESGLKTAADLVRLRQLGYDAFLIGERFMTEADPGAALQILLQGCLNTKDTRSKHERA